MDQRPTCKGKFIKLSDWNLGQKLHGIAFHNDFLINDLLLKEINIWIVGIPGKEHEKAKRKECYI